MLSGCLQRIRAVMRHALERLNTFVRVATRPGPAVVGLLCDLPRSREQLIAENALWKTRHKVAKPKVSSDTIVLIRTMAADNRLWGAERIRGELLKLGIRLAKRTPRTRFAASSRSPHDRERAVARCLR